MELYLRRLLDQPMTGHICHFTHTKEDLGIFFPCLSLDMLARMAFQHTHTHTHTKTHVYTHILMYTLLQKQDRKSVV